MQVQVQDAVVVFLSLAARYFDCMCSTPRVRSFDRLRSGSREVWSWAPPEPEPEREPRAQSSSEVGESTDKGTAGGRDLSASAREGSDWMGSWPPQVVSTPAPCPFLVWGNTIWQKWQRLQVGSGGQGRGSGGHWAPG